MIHQKRLLKIELEKLRLMNKEMQEADLGSEYKEKIETLVEKLKNIDQNINRDRSYRVTLNHICETTRANLDKSKDRAAVYE